MRPLFKSGSRSRNNSLLFSDLGRAAFSLLPLQQAVVPIATIPLSQSTLLALAGPAQAASTVAFGLVVGRYRLAVAACNHLHNLLYWNEHQE